MRGIAGRCVLVGGALLLAGCGSGGGDASSSRSANASGASSAPSSSPGPPVAMTITAKDFAFEPTMVTWAPGATISLTFKNTGHAEHSFTPDGSLAEAEAEGGGSKSITLVAPASGALSFHCKYHPQSMRGTIVIGGAAAAAPPPPAGASTYAPGGYGG